MFHRVPEEIDRPSHYGGTHCIEAMEKAFGRDAVILWCRMTAFKYLWRGGKKPGQALEKDVSKADWYLNYSQTLSRKNT